MKSDAIYDRQTKRINTNINDTKIEQIIDM
jgi:hypothetical protein